MIPWTIPAKINEAKYTKLLKDISVNTWSVIAMAFADNNIPAPNDFANDLLDHFRATYRYYEICDKDESVFSQAVVDTFREWHEYYEQLYTAYQNDINFEDIAKKISTRADASNNTTNAMGANEGHTTTREYDLPNKVIDPDSEDGYLTGKNKSDTNNTANSTEVRSNQYTSNNTSTDNRMFIRLKEEYLRHIRDIFEEFTNKFEDCFIHIF